jgi:hypothetical protein
MMDECDLPVLARTVAAYTGRRRFGVIERFGPVNAAGATVRVRVFVSSGTKGPARLARDVETWSANLWAPIGPGSLPADFVALLQPSDDDLALCDGPPERGEGEDNA